MLAWLTDTHRVAIHNTNLRPRELVPWLCSIEPCLPRLFFGASIATVNGCTEGASTLQVLLDEARTEVNVDLYQRRVTKRLETMDLARLNHKDISGAALEGFAVDRPHSPAFTNKLNLVIGVPVRARSRTRLSMKQEHRNARVSLLSSNKLMRATNKRQILLAHVMHLCHPPMGLDECGHNPVPRRTPVAARQISDK